MNETNAAPIPDHMREGLSILFIGYNPSLRSGSTGHHYANPHNRFWRLLYKSGLTPRLFKPEEDAGLLHYGYGFTNIVARPTRTAAEISREEYAEGAAVLRDKLQRFKPKLACFVGKGVYEAYSGRKAVQWGLQPQPVTEGVKEFVVPSSSGLVRLSFDEMVGHYSAIAKLLEA